MNFSPSYGSLEKQGQGLEKVGGSVDHNHQVGDVAFQLLDPLEPIQNESFFY